ncbi:metaxin-1-like [Lytechinus pictus]|uniref:metaxin-1-like n=1 Tax=Lytechinus pictus TaxID=7653 RepID=UPI0030BA1F5B
MAELMEMDCWKGDWGLPSIDRDCLKVMAYAQFAGAPIKVHRDRRLWRNISAHYPVFYSNGMTLKTADSIIEHLKQNEFNADSELNDQQRADILAYSSLLEEKLLPALQYTWWVDAKNYTEFSRPWFAKTIHFPFNYFIPGQLQRIAESSLEAKRGGLHLLDGELTQNVMKDAKYCLNMLSERLGQKEFFFGETPTSLDALVFSYLAPLIRVPFPSNTLQIHCKACDNLVMFCSRILQRYFPQVPQGSENTSRESRATTEESFDDPHKRRNQILSVLFAATAMVGYALFSGLVQFEIVDDEEMDDHGMMDDEEDDYQSQE